MFATVASRLQNDFSSLQNKSVDAKVARPIAQRDSENFQSQAQTWDTYLCTLRRATVEAIRAKRMRERDYSNILKEAGIWERRLEIALNNDCEENAREALLHKRNCTEMARNLKALLDKHSVQVNTLKSQLAFWENQLQRN